MNENFKSKLNKKISKGSGTPELESLLSRKRTRNSPEAEIFIKKHHTDMDEKILKEFGNMLDEKFAVVAEIKNDTKSINDKLESIMAENQVLKSEIIALKEENKEIKKSLEFFQRRAKLKNLIISGLNCLKDEKDLEKVIKELCEKSLTMHEPMIDRVYSVGDGKTLLVEFVKQSDVQAVLRNANKLKGTGIWINRDLTYRDRQCMKMLFEVKKKIVAVDKNERVVIRDGYMLFKNKKFFWDEEKGVYSAKEEDAQLITGLLKKYEERQAASASKNQNMGRIDGKKKVLM